MNIDRILLYNEKIAEGWNSLFGSLRRNLSLDAQTRELTICYVGLLNKAEYEVYQHVPEYLKAGGKPEHIQMLRSDELENFTPRQ